MLGSFREFLEGIPFASRFYLVIFYLVTFLLTLSIRHGTEMRNEGGRGRRQGLPGKCRKNNNHIMSDHIDTPVTIVTAGIPRNKRNKRSCSIKVMNSCCMGPLRYLDLSVFLRETDPTQGVRQVHYSSLRAEKRKIYIQIVLPLAWWRERDTGTQSQSRSSRTTAVFVSKSLYLFVWCANCCLY